MVLVLQISQSIVPNTNCCGFALYTYCDRITEASLGKHVVLSCYVCGIGRHLCGIRRKYPESRTLHAWLYVHNIFSYMYIFPDTTESEHVVCDEMGDARTNSH